MKAGVIVVMLLVAMAVAGCSQSVRYTSEEIKNYPLDIQEQIVKGQVSPGMTIQQVRYAWGAPDSRRLLKPHEGKIREEWVYTSFPVFDTKTLMFLDGRLLYISGEGQGKKE